MAESNREYCVAFVTAPPGDEADALARSLVEARVAACVNTIPSMRSTYRWKGEVAREDETLLIIKTTQDRREDLVRTVEELHSYDEPEVVFLAIDGGRAPYLDWIRESVKRKP